MLIPLLACAFLTADASRPNVLILFADDLRFDTLGAHGGAATTPNLDALARRGTSFSNVYCMGGNSPAVCLPSRNMFLSGNAYIRWRDENAPAGPNAKGKQGPKGLYAPATGPSLARTFRAAGYATYHHGKRGNTAPALQAHFEIDRYLADDDRERRSGEPGKEIVDAALAHLAARQDDRPFLMYLAFGNPHDPRVAADKYLQHYDPAKIPLPANWLPRHPFDNGELKVRDELLLPTPRTEAALRAEWRNYLATVAALDHHVGRLLADLERRDMLKNTIVLFTADQGIALGSHGLLGKQNLYDAGMKVPLVLAGPGIPAAKARSGLSYLFVVFPTLCDLAGIALPPGIDGRSFAAQIAVPAVKGRPELFFAYRHLQRGLRDDRFKLLFYPQSKAVQLFDLAADPLETRNLADVPEHRARAKSMTDRLRAAQREWGDGLQLE
ncbi:MAG TPA: sulfatase-like hydrolase/transferase [Planctomycetia bacterium]|nr:sulfatase-like hydrolase/transferase [Planctomycetia bacterium]